ncbi:MAG: hypothetical protein PHQ23_02675 [Candidatus Wallbacteria bacterium]|nr:hypothetical protein [Candidatus Wallbacteria bacterium]
MNQPLNIAQIADHLGISKTAVYKRIKLNFQPLKPHIFKQNSVTYIKPEGLALLVSTQDSTTGFNRLNADASNDSPSSGTDPFNLAFNQLNQQVEYLKTQVEEKSSLIRTLLDDQKQERERADTIIMSLTQQVRQLTAGSKTPAATPAEDPAPEQPAPAPEPTTPPETPSHVTTIGDLMKQRDQEIRDQATQKIAPPPDQSPIDPPTSEKITGLRRLFLELFNPVALRGRV